MRVLAARWVARPYLYRWVCFCIMCVGFVLVKVAAFGPAVIAPDLIAEFTIGPTELGIMAAFYLWGYAAIQIPTGVLADTLGPRRAVTIFMLVAAVGTFVFASALSYPMSLVGRGLMGLATGIVFVCTVKLLAHWFRPDEFATLNGILLMAGNLGTVAAAAPLALLVGVITWRPSFVLLSVLAAAIALLVFVLVRDSPNESDGSIEVLSGSRPRQPVSQRLALREVAGPLLLNRNLWLLALYAFALYGALMSIQGLWAVPYLMDVYNLPCQAASNMLTMWPMGLIVGSPLSGYFSDRVLRTRKGVVLGGVLLFSLPFLVLSLRPTGLPLELLYALFFFCGVTNSTVVVSFALLNDVLPRQIVGTATGIYNLWFFVGGAVYQQLTGSILSAFAIESGQTSVSGYRAVFLFCLVGVWAAAVAVLATRDRISVRQPVDG